MLAAALCTYVAVFATQAEVARALGVEISADRWGPVPTAFRMWRSERHLAPLTTFAWRSQGR